MKLKYIFLFLVILISNNLLSQVYKFDCIIIENNNLTLKVSSDPSCNKLSKFLKISRIPDKNEEKVTGYDKYSINKDNCYGVNFTSTIMAGKYLIEVEVIYNESKKYKVEKEITFE